MSKISRLIATQATCPMLFFDCRLHILPYADIVNIHTTMHAQRQTHAHNAHRRTLSFSHSFLSLCLSHTRTSARRQCYMHSSCSQISRSHIRLKILRTARLIYVPALHRSMCMLGDTLMTHTRRAHSVVWGLFSAGWRNLPLPIRVSMTPGKTWQCRGCKNCILQVLVKVVLLLNTCLTHGSFSGCCIGLSAPDNACIHTYYISV